MSNSLLPNIEQKEFLTRWDAILEQEEELARKDPNRQTPLTPELARQLLTETSVMGKLTFKQIEDRFSESHPRVVYAWRRIMEEYLKWTTP